MQPPNGTRNEVKNLTRRVEQLEAETRTLSQHMHEQVTAQKVLRNDVRWIVKVAMAAASVISVLVAMAFQLAQFLMS